MQHLEDLKNSIYKIIQFYNDIHIRDISAPVNVLRQPYGLAQIDQPMDLCYKNRWQLDLNWVSAKMGPIRNESRAYTLFKTEFQTEKYVLHRYAWRQVGMKVCLRKKECVLCVILTHLNLNIMH